MCEQGGQEASGAQEPHVDRTEAPATIGVLLSAAADDASLALTLDWGRTLLTHLHSAPWHEGADCVYRSQQLSTCKGPGPVRLPCQQAALEMLPLHCTLPLCRSQAAVQYKPPRPIWISQ